MDAGWIAAQARDLAVAALVWLGFIGGLFLGSILLPGATHAGAPRPDGTRERYTLNGFALFLLVIALLLAGTWLGVVPLARLGDLFWQLFAVANVFAFGLSAVLLVQGRRRRATHPTRTDPTGLLRDYYYGVEVSPRWFGQDLKLFSYRPSLIALGVLNLSFAAAQYELYGHLTPQMLLYQVLYGAYLFNYFQFEYGMLHTWDVIAERFGWMLVWGDYVLVPFFYSIPGWFLVHQLEPAPWPALAAVVALYLFGFWLFRGANEQKHRFKQDPGARIWGRPAQSLSGRLLVSGFWGIGRKLNYTGELCMYVAWTSLTGFGSLVPYTLPAWLAALFVHRARRDDKRCRAKYGDLWATYCARARFRMLPFIY